MRRRLLQIKKNTCFIIILTTRQSLREIVFLKRNTLSDLFVRIFDNKVIWNNTTLAGTRPREIVKSVYRNDISTGLNINTRRKIEITIIVIASYMNTVPTPKRRYYVFWNCFSPASKLSQSCSVVNVKCIYK